MRRLFLVDCIFRVAGGESSCRLALRRSLGDRLYESLNTEAGVGWGGGVHEGEKFALHISVTQTVTLLTM